MIDLLFLNGLGGFEFVVLLLVMLPGMLAIYLVLKYERNEMIPIWILAIFLIPFFGSMIYLMKYFIKDQRRSL